MADQKKSTEVTRFEVRTTTKRSRDREARLTQERGEAAAKAWDANTK